MSQKFINDDVEQFLGTHTAFIGFNKDKHRVYLF